MAKDLVRNLLKSALLWLAPVSFLALFFLWPNARLIALGLDSRFSSGLQSWASVLAEGDVQSAVWFTFWQAFVSTVATLVIALPAAYVLYRKSFQGQQIIRAIITIPLVLPTIVVAIIFVSFQKAHELYSNIGMSFWSENRIYWIIAAHVFINFAIAVRTIGGYWAGLDRSPEEAAEISGAGRLRTFISISAPQLKPAIISAAALVFLFCFTSFGVIVILGGGQVTSIETEISVAALQFLDLQKAAVLAIVQTAITLTAFALGQRFGRGAIGLDQISDSDQAKPIDRRDLPALVTTLAFIIGLLVIPILLVIARAFETESGVGLQNFINLAGRGDRDLLNVTVGQASLNSVRNLFVALALALPMGLAVSFLTSRRVLEPSVKSGARDASASRAARAGGKILDSAFMLPMGVSSVVLGLGFLITFGGGPLAIRSSWVVLPIVQALIALPLIIRVLQPALLGIESEQLEAAKTSGATAWQIWWRIELPIIAPALKTATVFAVLTSIGEFGAASLLVAGDQATISTVLTQLISRPGSSNYGMAMAMAALLVLFSTALVLLAQLKINTRSRKAL